VFTARYGLSPYVKQIRFVFKGLTLDAVSPNRSRNSDWAIGWMVQGSNSCRERNFSPEPSTLASRSTQPIQPVPGFFLRGKAAGVWWWPHLCLSFKSKHSLQRPQPAVYPYVTVKVISRLCMFVCVKSGAKATWRCLSVVKHRVPRDCCCTLYISSVCLFTTSVFMMSRFLERWFLTNFILGWLSEGISAYRQDVRPVMSLRHIRTATQTESALHILATPNKGTLLALLPIG
jgi:hypothetical protein